MVYVEVYIKYTSTFRSVSFLTKNNVKHKSLSGNSRSYRLFTFRFHEYINRLVSQKQCVYFNSNEVRFSDLTNNKALTS